MTKQTLVNRITAAQKRAKEAIEKAESAYLAGLIGKTIRVELMPGSTLAVTYTGRVRRSFIRYTGDQNNITSVEQLEPYVEVEILSSTNEQRYHIGTLHIVTGKFSVL